MIYWQLFYTFLLIGAFTFGGGYAMVAMIEHEVVGRQGWMTQGEFTDLLAVSQMTPGPIGINTATYAGYTAVANAGGSTVEAVGGAVVASVAVVAIPIALVLTLGGWLLRNRERPVVAAVLKAVRMVVVGLLLAAALSLLTEENFGLIGWNRRFVVSVVIFVGVFVLSWRYKKSPIMLIVASGLVGLLVYSF